MAFEAKILRVLVASPGDVGEERNVVPELINEWNAINAFSAKILLMPVKWETHSAPLMGDRPQAVINEQLVKDCDLLVGLFWTRIGTHTGVAVSGTAEEIEQFVNSNKPVMLYFSQSPIDPEKIEIDQFSVLKTFKEKMRLKGLTESYSSIPDFRQKFGRQLSINIGNLINNGNLVKATTSAKDKKVTDSKKEIKAVDLTTLTPVKDKLTDTKINDYLIKAIDTVKDIATGWASMPSVGSYLRIYTPIDYHDFGFQKLKPFLESRKIFEIKNLQKNPNARNIDSSFVRVIKKD